MSSLELLLRSLLSKNMHQKFCQGAPGFIIPFAFSNGIDDCEVCLEYQALPGL